MRKYITLQHPEEFKSKTLIFNHDTINGINVTCGFCGKHINISDKDQVCPECEENLLFPTWCSW